MVLGDISPLFNTKYPPKPRKTHLRNHFWPLESGFSAIATYKTYVFSKSSNVPILKFFLVIPDTFPIPKSLTEVMEDFFSLKTRSRPMCRHNRHHQCYNHHHHLCQKRNNGLLGSSCVMFNTNVSPKPSGFLIASNCNFPKSLLQWSSDMFHPD